MRPERPAIEGKPRVQDVERDVVLIAIIAWSLVLVFVSSWLESQHLLWPVMLLQVFPIWALSKVIPRP
jgi:hypothetical protein